MIELAPSKYMNLDKSVLNVTCIVLNKLKRKKIIPLTEFLSFVESKWGENIEEIALASLSILFVFGKVEYIQKNDSIIWIDK